VILQTNKDFKRLGNAVGSVWCGQFKTKIWFRTWSPRRLEKEKSMLLSKFDVAERQLLQAIRMFFGEEDPVSIHTLAEAAAQVLNDIGEKYGARSFLRDSDIIREDKRKEWLARPYL
jgi:hypothetical protein